VLTWTNCALLCCVFRVVPVVARRAGHLLSTLLPRRVTAAREAGLTPVLPTCVRHWCIFLARAHAPRLPPATGHTLVP